MTPAKQKTKRNKVQSNEILLPPPREDFRVEKEPLTRLLAETFEEVEENQVDQSNLDYRFIFKMEGDQEPGNIRGQPSEGDDSARVFRLGAKQFM